MRRGTCERRTCGLGTREWRGKSGGCDAASRHDRAGEDGPAHRPQPGGTRLRGHRLPAARVAGAGRGRRGSRRLGRRGRRAGRRAGVHPAGGGGRRGGGVRAGRHAHDDAARHRAHRDEHHRRRPQEPDPGRGPRPRRRPAGLPHQRQPGDGSPAAGDYLRRGRPGQRRHRRAGPGRHLRAVGLHGAVRDRRPPEVHREHARRRAYRRGRRGDGAGPAQRPGPRARPAHPRQLDRPVGDLEAARSGHARTRLVAGPRPDRHAASHPGADRGARGPGRSGDPGVRLGQVGLRRGGR